MDSELKPASDKRVRRLFTSLYIWLNILIGCGVLSWALVNWQCEDWLRFASFLVTGVIASVLRIRLPGTDGTASVSALFILIGIVDLGTPEALMIGALCAIAQTTWRSQARLIQIAFTTCTRATAIYVSALAYGYTRSRTFELAGLGVLTAIYFLATAIPVAGIISLTERKSLGSIFKGSRWMPPYYFVGASMAWLIGTVPHSIQWELPIICLPLVYVVHRSNRTLVTQVEREKKHVEQMNAVHLRTIEALALAIDAKDHTTHDHLQRVQIYAIEIAKDLKVPEHELEALRAAAVLHDIGKLAVPEHIISKPGKLTRSEFEKMKVHPVVGAEILERVEFPYPVVPIVRAHHEKWDGSGYPYGLKGVEIPVGARILAVVDCLDALASDRQYRKALPLDEAMAKVAAESGTSFDPDVVAALQGRYLELEALVRSSTPSLQPVLSTDIKVARGAAPGAGFAEEESSEIINLQKALDGDTNGGSRESSFNMPKAQQSKVLLREALAIIALRLESVLPFDAFSFFLNRDGVLVPAFVAGDDRQRLSSLQVPIGEGLVGWVAQTSKPIVNGNPSVEPGYLDSRTAPPILNSALAVPLRGGAETTRVLAIYRRSKDAFLRSDLDTLLAAASQIEDAIGRISTTSGAPGRATELSTVATSAKESEESPSSVSAI